MVAEACDKEFVIFSMDGVPGSTYLHRDEAEKLAHELLDAVKESYDAEPDPPVHKVFVEDFNSGNYPKNGNIVVINKDGSAAGISITEKLPKMVGYIP